jgi:phosphoserine phosphatase
MSHVVVLCCNPAAPALDEALAARVRAAVGGGAATWLAEGVACEIAAASDPAALRQAARAALGAAPVDATVVPAANRRKRLLVADMESTLIENEMIDELAQSIGIGEEVADITRRTMNGEFDFRDSLRERVALLAGVPAERLEELAGRIAIMPGAATLAATMRLHGAYTAIVSGGFRFYTDIVRRRLGFDFDEANDLEIAAGALTGEVREPVLNRDGKLEALNRLAGERNLTPADTIAVGDGANDVAMLQGAGMGVAFRAKPTVAAASPLRVDHGDLTALLYLQGYRREQFAAVQESAD